MKWVKQDRIIWRSQKAIGGKMQVTGNRIPWTLRENEPSDLCQRQIRYRKASRPELNWAEFSSVHLIVSNRIEQRERPEGYEWRIRRQWWTWTLSKTRCEWIGTADSIFQRPNRRSVLPWTDNRILPLLSSPSPSLLTLFSFYLFSLLPPNWFYSIQFQFNSVNNSQKERKRPSKRKIM